MCMNTTERKQVLLQRLLAVDDERQLQEIEELMDRQCAGEVLHFSSELRTRIDAALEQVHKGQVCSTAEMEQRLKPWSGK